MELKISKLTVLCQLFYPELVSTGQTLTELCEVLADLGVEIEVIAGPVTIVDRKSAIPRTIKYHKITINRVWGTRLPKLNLLGRIINQITYAGSVFFHLLFDRSSRPILVLTNPPYLAFTCAILRSLKIGKPYLYVIFDVYPDSAINLGILKKNSFIAKLWDWFNIFTYNHATNIVVIGRCMQEVIIKKMEKYQVDYRDKIRLIHIWSDDRLIQSVAKEENPFIKQWNLENKFIVSYSGNMGRFHDLETIMETAKLLQNYPDIIFLFVGEGYKKAWMIDYANKWKLINCQFHSYVPRENLGLVLSCVNLGLVSLSPGQEGLSVPSKTFGLLAVGVPVVAIMSSHSEIARILNEEDCGVVVEPGDSTHLRNALLSLYNNQQKRIQMGNNAKNAIAQKYNLRAAAQAYFELIRDVNNQII